MDHADDTARAALGAELGMTLDELSQAEAELAKAEAWAEARYREALTRQDRWVEVSDPGKRRAFLNDLLGKASAAAEERSRQATRNTD
ncbi:MAG TPA: hypothetical protein VE690_09805 [Rhodopila sp.]|nr:hypothetical protein [Rhodopila sp.]